jgi:hypothetical protein
MGHLLDALERTYRALGFEAADGGDQVFIMRSPAATRPQNHGSPRSEAEPHWY